VKFSFDGDSRSLVCWELIRSSRQHSKPFGEWTLEFHARSAFCSGRREVFGLRTTFQKHQSLLINHSGERRTQFGVRSDINYQVRKKQNRNGLYVAPALVDSSNQQFNFLGTTAFDEGTFKRSGVRRGFICRTLE